MRFLATALSTLLPCALLTAQQPSPRTPNSEELAALQTGLAEMGRLDQLHRTPVSWGTTDPKELARLKALDDEAQMEETKRRWREGVSLPKEQAAELMAKQRILDQANFDKLIGWVRTYGYPDPERLGIDAPTPVVVLVHADTKWFASVAKLLHAEAKAGRMPGKEYAALSDRKAQHDGKMQLYGTCHRFDPKLNEILPPEIADIEKTNQARAKLGIPPLTEYLIVKPKQQPVEPAKLKNPKRDSTAPAK